MSQQKFLIYMFGYKLPDNPNERRFEPALELFVQKILKRLDLTVSELNP